MCLPTQTSCGSGVKNSPTRPYSRAPAKSTRIRAHALPISQTRRMRWTSSWSAQHQQDQQPRSPPQRPTHPSNCFSPLPFRRHRLTANASFGRPKLQLLSPVPHGSTEAAAGPCELSRVLNTTSRSHGGASEPTAAITPPASTPRSERSMVERTTGGPLPPTITCPYPPAVRMGSPGPPPGPAVPRDIAQFGLSTTPSPLQGVRPYRVLRTQPQYPSGKPRSLPGHETLGVFRCAGRPQLARITSSSCITRQSRIAMLAPAVTSTDV